MENLIDFFELSWLTDQLRASRFSRISLQFPDQWLPLSTKVVQELQASLPDRFFFMLADSSFSRYFLLSHLELLCG